MPEMQPDRDGVREHQPYADTIDQKHGVKNRHLLAEHPELLDEQRAAERICRITQRESVTKPREEAHQDCPSRSEGQDREAKDPVKALGVSDLNGAVARAKKPIPSTSSERRSLPARK